MLVVLALSSGTTSALTTTTPDFKPTIDVLLCNGLNNNFAIASIAGPNPLPGAGCTETAGNRAPGANPNITFDLNIPTGDINFGPETLMLFTSPDFTIAGDADFVDGSLMGGIHNEVALGLTVGTCASSISPDFAWYDATTDWDNQIAVPEGVTNRFSPLANDDVVPIGMGDPDSPGVSQFVDFTARLLDPDGSGGGPSGDGTNTNTPDGSLYDPVAPHARYFGITQVPLGRDWQVLQVMIFQPGALQGAFLANPANVTHPYARLDPGLGWISLIILNDPANVEGSPAYVSDFCTPLRAIGMMLGDPAGGGTRLTNPSTAPGPGIDGQGTHINGGYILSYRDWDKDGIQNDMDTCPHVTNVDDPYNGADTDADTIPDGAEPDGDMFDGACDPTPLTPDNFGDYDNDGYKDPQDNCPAVGNSLGSDVPPANQQGTNNQLESESTTARNVTAPDGGLASDEMGDSCETGYTTPPGQPAGSNTLSNGTFIYGFDTDATCIGGTDTTPADGFCDAGGLSASTLDIDGDSYKDIREVLREAAGNPGLNTDPVWKCPNNTKQDAWPSDMNNSAKTDLLDLLPFKTAFNSDMNDPLYNRRVDLDNTTSVPGGGKDVVLTDLLPFKPQFNVSCKPLTQVCYITKVGAVVRSLGCTAVEGPPGTWTATVIGGCTPGFMVNVWVGNWGGPGPTTGTATCPSATATTTAPTPAGARTSTASAGPKAAGNLVCTAVLDASALEIVRCTDP